jgi:hypothetical protein
VGLGLQLSLGTDEVLFNDSHVSHQHSHDRMICVMLLRSTVSTHVDQIPKIDQ